MNVQRILLLTLGLAVVALMVWQLADRRLLPEPNKTRVDSGAPSKQAYPPPPGSTKTPTPAPTNTPAADALGYMPSPLDAVTVTLSISESAYAELLGVIETSFDGADPEPLAAMVDDSRYLLDIFDVEQRDSEGATSLLSNDAEYYLGQIMNAGTPPKLQGYWLVEDKADWKCLEVLLHRFQGQVAFPTPGTAFGPRYPATFPEDAAAFRFCSGLNGEWTWMRWQYGSYYRIVDAISGESTDGNFYMLRP